MKSEKMMLSSRGLGVRDALSVTESAGAENGLTKKERLHLRLLAEELFGLLQGIAGDVEAEYWIVTDEKEFELHMRSRIDLTDKMRDRLIAVSSSGENAAARGVMGKLRVMIAQALFSRSTNTFASGMALGIMSAGGIEISASEEAYQWSLNRYRDEMELTHTRSQAAEEAWDELEQSVVANVADEIEVSIVGCDVEITVFKAF